MNESAYHESGHAVSGRQANLDLWKRKIGVLVEQLFSPISVYYRLNIKLIVNSKGFLPLYI